MSEANSQALPLWRLTAMRQLMVVTFFAFTSFFVTLAALPSWAVLGGARVATAGTVTTAMLVCTVAVQLLVPAAVTRLGITAVVGFGLIALGAPSPLYLLSQDLWWLVLISALRGAGFAVLTVLGASLAVRIAPIQRRGEAIGLYGLAVALPNLVAVPGGVALTLWGHFGWVAWVAASPLLALPVVAPLVGRVETHQLRERTQALARREVLGILLPSVLLLVVTLAGGGLVTFLPIARPSGSLAVAALALFGLSAALLRWGVGPMADRAGTRVLLPLALVAAILGMAGLGAGLVLNHGVVATGVVLAAAFVFGAGYGAAQNLTLIEAFAQTERHDLASAVWNVCFDLGTALGAFAVGLVAASGLGIPGAYVGCSLLIAVTAPLIQVLRLRPARTRT